MPLFKPPSTDRTAAFYGQLMSDQRSHPFWGRQRFDADKAARSPSIRRHFTGVVAPLLRPTDRVLDVGCGAGIFLHLLAPHCRELTGVEVSPAFVARAREDVAARRLANVRVVEAGAERLPFADASFDAVLVVDVLHHLTHIPEALAEIRRVLAPGGRLLVFEPNKLNPVLYLGCLLDRNEWGLLALGRPGLYRRLLSPYFRVESIVFNGVIIGPDSRFNLAIAAALDHPVLKPWLGWLLPKMFVQARRPD